MIGRGSAEMHMGEDGELKGDDSKPVVLEVAASATAATCGISRSKLRAGEITGVYGFMGIGQVELARALFGKVPHAAGR
jgi:ribose transport system ATP-binding protein